MTIKNASVCEPAVAVPVTLRTTLAAGAVGELMPAVAPSTSSWACWMVDAMAVLATGTLMASWKPDDDVGLPLLHPSTDEAASMTASEACLRLISLLQGTGDAHPRRTWPRHPGTRPGLAGPGGIIADSSSKFFLPVDGRARTMVTPRWPRRSSRRRPGERDRAQAAAGGAGRDRLVDLREAGAEVA